MAILISRKGGSSGGGAPSGPAGGVLAGTYPNPSFSDATITALAASAWAANAVPVGTGVDTLTQLALAANTFPARSSAGNVAAKTITDFGLSLVDDANAAAGRTTLDVFSTAEIATELADQKRCMEILVSDPNGAAITTGDGKAFIMVPLLIGSQNLVAAAAAITTVSSSGVPTIQIRNVTQAADMLSTRITIDVNLNTSYASTTQPVIDTNNDDVATGDLIAVDIDVAGTGAKGLIVALTFEAP